MKSLYTKKERENACDIKRMEGKNYVVLAQEGYDCNVALVVPLKEIYKDGRNYRSTDVLVHRYNEKTHEHEYFKRHYHNDQVKAARYESVRGSLYRGSWHVFDLKKS